MSKKVENSRSMQYSIGWYVISFGLFIASCGVLASTVQGDPTWLILAVSAFCVSAITSYRFPKLGHNTKSFFIGIVLLVLGLIMILDMYDESIHEYGGGFSGGNGFLFDGLGNLAYVFIIPVLFCLAQAFLIINSVKKVKR